MDKEMSMAIKRALMSFEDAIVDAVHSGIFGVPNRFLMSDAKKKALEEITDIIEQKGGE
jgi:hypothetical protein